MRQRERRRAKPRRAGWTNILETCSHDRMCKRIGRRFAERSLPVVHRTVCLVDATRAACCAVAMELAKEPAKTDRHEEGEGESEYEYEAAVDSVFPLPLADTCTCTCTRACSGADLGLSLSRSASDDIMSDVGGLGQARLVRQMGCMRLEGPTAHST